MMDDEIAQKRGYDCGLNGPGLVNCHHTIFEYPEWRDAWELGMLDGVADRKLYGKKEGK